MVENEISAIILDAAIAVHKELGGPGLLESVYEEALAFELQDRGVSVERQVPVPLVYKGHRLGTPLRLDLLVEEKVVVECKAVELYNTIFDIQVLTYLRLKSLKLGLVVNFGATTIKEGIHRVVNRL
ncbi:MAG: GxxExxY protein [Kiritimatiellae bacterium]|jgi:GxxExxY protein|nr:GxxExxY protein [Kiritimatiellia bacterium]MDD2347514.1 GxxExxY protein [Kiritimatiellia bacterium]MDD3583148.1 GxxExxY protein [Kiritimatiellia bacterium]